MELKPGTDLSTELEFKVKVLDKGYVRMLPRWVMGYGDLEIVNDARTSFNKEVSELKPADNKLIKYLAKHQHTSCFRGTACKIEVYAPLMVARQWWKYIIGSQHQEDKLQDSLTNWNESSRRYITEEVEYYVPQSTEWRSILQNKKQGSGEPLDTSEGEKWTQRLLQRQEQSNSDYNQAIAAGICPEEARLFLLGYGLYVRWRWTASLQSVSHFLNQRLKEDSQSEIRDYARATLHIVKHFWDTGLKELLAEDFKDF